MALKLFSFRPFDAKSLPITGVTGWFTDPGKYQSIININLRCRWIYRPVFIN
jgi:hypothetical protein